MHSLLFAILHNAPLMGCSSSYSALEGEPGDLDLGDEVEFHFAHKTNKVSAENIRKVARGSVAPEVCP